MVALELKKIINDVMSKAGYLRKGPTWYRNLSTIVSLVNLQKSNYDDVWFINIAFWIKALGEPQLPPPEHLCHVRIRATAAFPGLRSRIEECCSLTSKLTDEKREAYLVQIIENNILPFLDRASTDEGLQSMIVEGRFDSGFVRQMVREVWSLNSAE